MVDEAAREGPAEDSLLVVYKHADTLVFEFANDAGPQIDHFFVIVSHALLVDTLEDVLLAFLVEETEKQLHRFIVRDDFQLVGILDIHDFVADIVSSLDQVD